METAPEPQVGGPGARALVFTGLVSGALLAAAVVGDGSDVDGILPVGGATVALLAAALAAVGLGRLPLPRVGRSGGTLLAATALLVVWIGTTVAWSIVPDRSWDAFDRSVVFAVFLGLGIFVAGLGARYGARLGASALAVVTGVVLTWALLAKTIPSLDPEGDRVARLREPVGYWNALALLCDVALGTALWLGAVRGHRTIVRVAGGLLAFVATLTLLLTLSRAGLVAGVAAVALWLVLSEERVEGGLLLVASVVPAGLVAAWAFTRPALVEDGAARSDRVADGAAFGGLALLGAALVAGLVVLGARRSLGATGRGRAGRGLAVAGALGALAAAVALALAVGNTVSAGLSCSEVVNDPSRLGTLDPNNRLCWWDEALDVFAGHAPEGAGAGTFEIARKRYRVDARSVLQPHSVPLQQLADGGLVALGLFVALVATAAAVCVCALRRLGGRERAAAVALVAAPLAYGVHALVDYSWDFLAATAPAMVALGVLCGAGRPAGVPRRRLLLGLSAVLLGLALLVSFASPRLAERSVRASTRALDERDYGRARDRALWARFFDPLSVEPVFALARIAERQGLPLTAERRYVQAVELQPENPETWYALGIYELQVLGKMCAAYRFLNDAYTLDPAGNQWFPGGPLDVARDAVNAGACEPD
jgi:hypothetical protein